MLILILNIIFIIGFSGLYYYLFDILLNIFNSPYYWFLYVAMGFFSAIILLLLFIFLFLFFSRFGSYKSKFKHFIVYCLFDFARLFCKIKIEVIGKENIPNKTFVVYSNHKSMLDPLIIYLAYKKQMSAVAKSTLKKVPVLAGFMKNFKVVLLNRENEREGVKNLLEAISYVKDGCNFIIFPEGGIITREVETMCGFKAGAFRLATKSDAIISPVSLVGTSKISKRCPWLKTRCKVIIHKPISKEEYENLNTNDLGEKVSKIIDDGVNSYAYNKK